MRVPLRDVVGNIRWYDVLVAPALFFAIRFASFAIRRALGGIDDHTQFLAPRTTIEIAVWVVVSIVAGVCEEIVFRGIFFRIFEEGFGTTVAIVISSALFGLLHAMNQGATLWSSSAIALEAASLSEARRQR